MDKLANQILIWKLLVSYANTGGNFRTLFSTCMNYCGTVGADSLADADVGVGVVGRRWVTVVINETGVSVSFCRALQKGLTLEDGARKYQQDLKRVRRWWRECTS